MAFKISPPFFRVLGIGALAGMRSVSAPAITSHLLSRHPSKALQHSPLKFMQSKTVANVLKFAALAELVGDKLPAAPNRTEPVGVVFRGLSGALSGASMYKAKGGKAATGALLGMASAVTATYISFLVRKQTVKYTKIADPYIGAVEDALVAGAGIGLASMAKY